MVCVFCIAAFMLIAGAVTAAAVDKMEESLGERAEGPVRRVAESDSVTKWELDVKVGKKAVPVAITVYKEQGRVRIQILTHDLSREEAEKLEDELAELLEAKIVSRASGHDESKVKESKKTPEPAPEPAEETPKDERAAAPTSERPRP
jgi:hypothetical protein